MYHPKVTGTSRMAMKWTLIKKKEKKVDANASYFEYVALNNGRTWVSKALNSKGTQRKIYKSRLMQEMINKTMRRKTELNQLRG